MRQAWETLLVCGVGLILVLLLGAVNPFAGYQARPKALATRFGSGGKQIWLGLYNTSMERESAGRTPIWPQESDAYAASTEFFVRALREKWLEGFGPADFGARELPSPDGTNSSALTADCNGWCVTLNCTNGTRPETPFLFSRNFCKTPARRRDRLPSYGDSLNDITGLCPRTRPFRDETGVVITWGGSMKILSAKALATPGGARKYFNPAGADLPFLHP